MLDISSDANNSIDGMLGAFFGNISQRAFGRMGRQINTLENKFKQLGNVAQSRFTSMRAGADKVADAVASINRRLREQAERMRNMPKMPRPPRQTAPSGTPQSGDTRGGRGRGRRGPYFGGTSSGHMYAGGFGGIGGFGALGAAYGIGSIARGFGAFDANIHTLMAEAGPDIKQVGGQAGLTQNILDIAGATQFSSGETAELLIAMVKDGVKLNDALSEVPNVLKLAVAESTDLATAWATTNTFVSGLNVPLSESVRLMDMMSNATSLSKLQLKDIQYIAGQSLSLYKEIAGFSEEGFLGISGILGPLFRPERIGTGLKQLSLLLPQAASGQLAGSKNKVFQDWGVNITDAGGNLLDEVSVLKEFERVFAGMSGEARNVELAKVFGTEAAPVFSALIGQSAKLAENMQAIRKKGTLDEKFAIHSEALTSKWKKLTGAGDSLIKKFVMILNEGNAFGGGIGWVTQKISQLTTFMEENKASIQAWWGNFREIMGGLFNLVATGIEKAASFWSGLGEGEKTVLAIGAVIGAFVLGPVTGLIAAGALIVAKWKPIREFFIKLWDKLDEPVLNFIKTVRDATMRVVNWIRRQWDEMSPYFAKIFKGIGFIATNAWKVIRFVASNAWEVIKVVWQPVSAFFKVLWQGVLLVTEVAWFAVKNVIKGVVIAIEAMWNGLKAVFNWAPVKAIRGGFMALVGFFADLVGKLKAPFQSLLDFVTGIFEKIANGIETVRAWFTRGDDGQMTLSVAIEEPKPLKVALPPAPMQKTEVPPISSQTPSAATKQAETTYYETRAAKPATAGVAKPKPILDDFVAGLEKDNKEKKKERSERQRAFGVKTSARTMQRGEIREFAQDINHAYVTKEQLYQLKADTKKLAIKADEAHRMSVLVDAHALKGRSADVSRVRLFNRLQREFPKLFEQFYRTDKAKTPSIPKNVLSGDERAFSEWTEKLTGRMERLDARLKTPSTQTALGGLDRGGITADRLLNREREKKKAFETLEATRIIRFPKLDDAQAEMLGDVFRAGFIVLSDIQSASLSELQKQTMLMGGTVDLNLPVIHPQADSALDDLVRHRFDRIRNLQDSETEHGRGTATGQRVAVSETQTSGTGNITIEKIEIHADSQQSAREIARAVLNEFEKLMRERNY